VQWIHEYHVEEKIETNWTKKQKVCDEPPQLVMVKNEVWVEVQLKRRNDIQLL